MRRRFKSCRGLHLQILTFDMKDKAIKLEGSVEERVKQLMEKSGVVEDLKKFHHLSEDMIRKELTSAMEYSDKIGKIIGKYNRFLLAKFPEFCE